jgi:4'-phosphopantetheinyl transferase EntD
LKFERPTNREFESLRCIIRDALGRFFEDQGMISTPSEWPRAHWLDADTVLVLNVLGDYRAALLPNELAIVGEMTLQRSLEFASGRHEGRLALAAIGQPPASIPMGAGGEPIFPQGVVGSLSHTSRHAAALVSRAYRHASVGVDVGDVRTLGKAAARLMTTAEIALVTAKGWASTEAQAQNVVFGAKEALFKCQYPLTQKRDLDFDEVTLVAGGHSAGLSAQLTSTEPQLAAVITRIEIFCLEIQQVSCAVALLPIREGDVAFSDMKG